MSSYQHQRSADVAGRTLFGALDALVGEEGEAVTDGLGVDEAHRLLVAGLAQEALVGPSTSGKTTSRSSSTRSSPSARAGRPTGSARSPDDSRARQRGGIRRPRRSRTGRP